MEEIDVSEVLKKLLKVFAAVALVVLVIALIVLFVYWMKYKTNRHPLKISSQEKVESIEIELSLGRGDSRETYELEIADEEKVQEVCNYFRSVKAKKMTVGGTGLGDYSSDALVRVHYRDDYKGKIKGAAGFCRIVGDQIHLTEGGVKDAYQMSEDTRQEVEAYFSELCNASLSANNIADEEPEKEEPEEEEEKEEQSKNKEYDEYLHKIWVMESVPEAKDTNDSQDTKDQKDKKKSKKKEVKSIIVSPSFYFSSIDEKKTIGDLSVFDVVKKDKDVVIDEEAAADSYLKGEFTDGELECNFQTEEEITGTIRVLDWKKDKLKAYVKFYKSKSAYKELITNSKDTAELEEGIYFFRPYSLDDIKELTYEDSASKKAESKPYEAKLEKWGTVNLVPVKLADKEKKGYEYHLFLTDSDDNILYDLNMHADNMEIAEIKTEDVNADKLTDITVTLTLPLETGKDDSELTEKIAFCQKKDYTFEYEKKETNVALEFISGNFDLLAGNENKDDIKEAYEALMKEGSAEWIISDINKDEINDLILRSTKSDKRIIWIVACDKDKARIEERDSGDATSYSYLGSTGKMVYFTPYSNQTVSSESYWIYHYDSDWSKAEDCILVMSREKVVVEQEKTAETQEEPAVENPEENTEENPEENPDENSDENQGTPAEPKKEIVKVETEVVYYTKYKDRNDSEGQQLTREEFVNLYEKETGLKFTSTFDQ